MTQTSEEEATAMSGRAKTRGRRRPTFRRVALATVACALCLGSTEALAAAPNPDFVFAQIPNPSPPAMQSPRPWLEGACGVAVDSEANFYVSSYYDGAVNVFRPAPLWMNWRPQVDQPDGGPCALAVAADGSLYVNSYHRNVEKLVPSTFPPNEKTTYASAGVIDSSHPTGAALDGATGVVYVDARTYVAAYDSSGSPVMDGGEPLRIGEGSLGDGYGIAVSAFPGTAGRIYVPDAADGTVKVYDPTIDSAAPVATIDGAETPRGGFVSLRDAAIAVDRATGEIYVLDNLQPEHTERPEAVVYVFWPSGNYHGRLKFNVIHGRPSGLAVDNSSRPTQGRVYVTSGNTERASVYAYPPESATDEARPAEPPPGAAALGAVSSIGSPPGEGAVAASASGPVQPVATASEIAQRGDLRVISSGRIAPRALPREGVAPIAVSVGGRIETTDGSPVPQLKTFRIELNRHGRLDLEGLPTCPEKRIDPASTSRALAACRAALVGDGRFWADISLEGQEPYPAKGRLLVFNGRRGGKPVLLGHIFSPRPFASSFVLAFELGRKRRGTYGTVLTTSLSRSLGDWGNLTGIQMTLSRRFSHGGVRRSFLSAGCPAPKGFPGAIFPFARASFAFAGGERLAVKMTESCRVRR